MNSNSTKGTCAIRHVTLINNGWIVTLFKRSTYWLELFPSSYSHQDIHLLFITTDKWQTVSLFSYYICIEGKSKLIGTKALIINTHCCSKTFHHSDIERYIYGRDFDRCYSLTRYFYLKDPTIPPRCQLVITSKKNDDTNASIQSLSGPSWSHLDYFLCIMLEQWKKTKLTCSSSLLFSLYLYTSSF